MTPIETVQYIVEQLHGTPYEPFVNVLLFLLFLVAILVSISLLLGRKGQRFISTAIKSVTTTLSEQSTYAPEVERLRARAEPYVELVASSFFAFVGLYSTVVVGLMDVLAMGHTSAWAICIAWVWVLASIVYTRVNIAAATWAYHRIRDGRS